MRARKFPRISVPPRHQHGYPEVLLRQLRQLGLIASAREYISPN